MALDYQESVPLFDNGDSLTGYCTADVEGGRFLMISGATSDGLPSVAHNDGTKPIFGVSAHSAVSGTPVGIHHAREIVTQVQAGAALTAGVRVKSDATGQAVPETGTPAAPTAGEIIAGTAFDDAAIGALAFIDREVI